MPRSSSLKGKKNEQTKKSRENILKNKQNVEVEKTPTGNINFIYYYYLIFTITIFR